MCKKVYIQVYCGVVSPEGTGGKISLLRSTRDRGMVEVEEKSEIVDCFRNV